DLRLQSLELAVVDDPLVAEIDEMFDLIRRSVRGCGAADVFARGCILRLGLSERVLVHLSAACDQIDEDAEVRKHDHEDRPECLGPTGQVRATKNVGEDADQQDRKSTRLNSSHQIISY